MLNLLDKPVESTALKAIAYGRRTLDLTFDSGHIYRYFNVPRAIFDALLNADSKGRYFHDHIRDRYHFAQLK